MKPWLRKGMFVLLVVVGAAQFARPARTNPSVDRSHAVQAYLQAGHPAAAVITRACGDCHSNETRWPWYSRVAPVSWLVAHDVNEGREAVNFSTWGMYSPDRQRKLLAKACDEVREGEMPMFVYTLMHTDARLSAADVQSICTLTIQAASR